MRIHDPDVVYTDLGLAILGAFSAWRLWKQPSRTTLTTSGSVIMAALASAALFGAIFHAFFPANTTTRAGFLAWVPVSLSILTVASALLSLGLRLLVPQLSTGVRRLVVAIYALSFAFVVLFIDESYGTIVRFYAPTLILFLIAAVRQAIRTVHDRSSWWLLSFAFGLSIVAALTQQARIAVHPVYFDHNALYHVLQGIALVMLFIGFRRVSEPNPAPRTQ